MPLTPYLAPDLSPPTAAAVNGPTSATQPQEQQQQQQTLEPLPKASRRVKKSFAKRPVQCHPTAKDSSSTLSPCKRLRSVANTRSRVNKQASEIKSARKSLPDPIPVVAQSVDSGAEREIDQSNDDGGGSDDDNTGSDTDSDGIEFLCEVETQVDRRQRPFKCSLCSKTSKRRGDIVSHIQSVHKGDSGRVIRREA